MSINETLTLIASKMQKSIEALQVELTKVRTGRAHPSLIERVMVSSYGSETPLQQMASIVAEDARTLVINAWDKSQVNAIEKAITMADLGLNPAVQGTVIRVPLPALTQERRAHLAKLVKTSGEQCKIAVRNARRDALNTFKQLKKDKVVTEDDERQGQVRLQKLTDDFIVQVDKLVDQKQDEITSV